MKLLILAGALALTLLACSTPLLQPKAVPTVVPAPPMAQNPILEAIAPTLAVRPTPTPVPPPTATLVPEPTPTPLPEPTATPAPTPTPTPKWRPADKPEVAKTEGWAGFRVTSGPTLDNNQTLRISATLDGHSVAPTQVQVWQSLTENAKGDCPTDRPIALVDAAGTTGFTQIQWRFCSEAGQKHRVQVDDVPWVPGSWSYSQRERRRTSEPLIGDWSLTVSLDNQDVEALEYSKPWGCKVVVLAGQQVLAVVNHEC